MATLDAALELAPDHLSLYALTLDDPFAEGLTGTRPATTCRPPPARDAGARCARPRQDEDRAAAQYHHAVHRLAADGWRGYEISNWAQPGHESRHNLAYWERRPYEAVGPGAHAFDGVTRRWNAARLDGYLAALTPAEARRRACHPADREDARRRRPRPPRPSSWAFGPTAGVPLAAAHEPPLADSFGWALAAELLDVTEDDRIVLTTRGRLLSNELFSPARLSASDVRRRVDTRSRRLLRCRHTVSTLTHRVLTHAGEQAVGASHPPLHRPPGPPLAGDPSGRHRGIRHDRHAGRQPGARRALSASACPARRSATSSPSSRRPAC